jgi:hypothetical protein
MLAVPVTRGDPGRTHSKGAPNCWSAPIVSRISYGTRWCRQDPSLSERREFRLRAFRQLKIGSASFHRAKRSADTILAFKIWIPHERWVAKKRATGSVAADPKRRGWRSPIEMGTLLTAHGDPS